MMNKTGTQRLETHRLILRRCCAEDAEEMFRNWASDPEVTRFLTWPTHANADVTRKVLESWASRYGDGGFFQWLIEWKENGQAIGNIAVVKLDEAKESADMGYCLGREYSRTKSATNPVCWCAIFLTKPKPAPKKKPTAC